MLARLYQAALDLQNVCAGEGWAFCFIGGIALLRWSDPRMTKDADVTVFTDFGGEERYIQVLLSHFKPRRPDAAEFALQARVVLLQHPNGIPLDVALGGLPFEKRTVERSSLWRAADDCELRTCCAEDLIVHKSFAARGQDWVDVERIIQRQGERLNVGMILEELEPLVALKEEPEIITQLKRLFVAYGLRKEI